LPGVSLTEMLKWTSLVEKGAEKKGSDGAVVAKTPTRGQTQRKK